MKPSIPSVLGSLILGAALSVIVARRHTDSTTCPKRANLETMGYLAGLTAGLETPGIDARVDPEPIERRFLRGLAGHRAPDTRRQLQSVE